MIKVLKKKFKPRIKARIRKGRQLLKKNLNPELKLELEKIEKF